MHRAPRAATPAPSRMGCSVRHRGESGSDEYVARTQCQEIQHRGAGDEIQCEAGHAIPAARTPCTERHEQQRQHQAVWDVLCGTHAVRKCSHDAERRATDHIDEVTQPRPLPVTPWQRGFLRIIARRDVFGDVRVLAHGSIVGVPRDFRARTYMHMRRRAACTALHSDHMRIAGITCCSAARWRDAAWRATCTNPHGQG